MGSLMFISFDDLLIDFAKDHDLHEWIILVSSHEICGSLTLRASYSGVSTAIQFESKYDNIEFVNSLRPTPTAMEHAYGADNRTFVELYTSQLINSEPYADLCSVVDMIVNDDCNVMIVMAAFEFSAHIPDILRDFIEDEFGVIGYLYSDLKRLSKYHDTDMYKKIVSTSSFEVPDSFTGRNFEVIMANKYTDDVDEIRKNLEAQKVIASDMVAKPGEENDLGSIFFNKFTETLEDKVKEILDNKDIEMIKELCRKKKIRIAPNSTKEFLVDKLMHNIRKDAAREVEYQDTHDI